MNEIWDLVDNEGRYVGEKWPRSDHANIPEGLYHPCVEVWVRIGDKILLAKRHPNKSEGLKYDAPGGAVVSGESVIDGAVRELFEEVGIRASKEELKYLGAVIGRKAYAVSYLLVLDSLPQIQLQPTEVIGYKLVAKSEIEKMMELLCEGCRKRYAIFENQIF